MVNMSVHRCCETRIELRRKSDANDNLWLTEATGMDTNCCHMLHDSNFALFWAMGGVVDTHWGKRKNWRCCNYCNFGDKNHGFRLPAKR